MDPRTLILTTNLILSVVIFGIVAKIYVLPRLDKWGLKAVMVPIMLLQSTRHLGLMFLASGAVFAGMPAVFAYPAALGDFAVSLMALAAIPLILKSSKMMIPVLWLVTIFGTLDFLVAIALASIFHAAGYMGAAWWIPAMWVPGLLVAHFVSFVVLWRQRKMQ